MFGVIEKEFIERWRNTRQRQFDRLMARLAQQFETRQIEIDILDDDDFWELWQQELIDVIAPFLTDAILIQAGQAAEEIAAEFGVRIDQEVVNRRAGEWAIEHADKLVKERSRVLNQTITETDSQRISAIVARWFESAEDFDALRQAMANVIVTPSRARMIAATEATRAAAQGNLITWREADLITDNMLAQAELVPPAHPGCRCWLVFVPGKGIVWRTAMDELVDRGNPAGPCRVRANQVIVPVEAASE